MPFFKLVPGQAVETRDANGTLWKIYIGEDNKSTELYKDGVPVSRVMECGVLISPDLKYPVFFLKRVSKRSLPEPDETVDERFVKATELARKVKKALMNARYGYGLDTSGLY